MMLQVGTLSAGAHQRRYDGQQSLKMLWLQTSLRGEAEQRTDRELPPLSLGGRLDRHLTQELLLAMDGP
jgi:hypothetical protein